MARVTVLIPAYNSGATLFDTLGSLSVQRYRDFCVVIVDDCSTHPVEQVTNLFSHALKINVLRNQVRMGVARSLNEGLMHCDSEFVMRIDSDDVAHPNRLLDQLKCLDFNRVLDGVGSFMVPFKTSGSQILFENTLIYPKEPDSIAIDMLFSNALAHPSMMIRREFFDRFGAYNSQYESAEDYELWTRAIARGSKLANIDRPLTYFRRHARQVSIVNQRRQINADIQVKRKYLSELVGIPIETVLPFFSDYVKYRNIADASKSLSDFLPVFRKIESRLGSGFSSKIINRIGKVMGGFSNL